MINELLTRAAASAEQIGARSLIISGGVACNSGLREAAASARLPYPVYFPTPGLSTDNAAMIAAAAFVNSPAANSPLDAGQPICRLPDASTGNRTPDATSPRWA